MASHGYHWENALAGIFIAVTPADAALSKIPTAGIYVGTGGDLVVKDMDNNIVTFANVLGGTVLPIKVQEVRVASTAAEILALY